MKKNGLYLDVLMKIVIIGCLCLIVFLSGFYLGFSEYTELYLSLPEKYAIHFSNENRAFVRFIVYGFTGLLFIFSTFAHFSEKLTVKIVGTVLFLFSLAPAWYLLDSTPGLISRIENPRFFDLNRILYLDIAVFPIIVLATLLSLFNVWSAIKKHRKED